MESPVYTMFNGRNWFHLNETTGDSVLEAEYAINCIVQHYQIYENFLAHLVNNEVRPHSIAQSQLGKKEISLDHFSSGH